jgi:hypothetical protein
MAVHDQHPSRPAAEFKADDLMVHDVVVAAVHTAAVGAGFQRMPSGLEVGPLADD